MVLIKLERGSLLSKKRIVMLFVYTMFLAAIMMVVSSSLYAQVETGPTGSEPTLNRTVKGETEESAEDAKRVIHNHYHYHITTERHAVDA